MTFRKASMFVTFLTVLPLVSVGCATKKHVREAIAPVQNQVNQTQGQVSALEKQTADNKQEIVDLDRQVSAADEKAVDANNRATAAADAAARPTPLLRRPANAPTPRIPWRNKHSRVLRNWTNGSATSITTSYLLPSKSTSASTAATWPKMSKPS